MTRRPRGIMVAITTPFDATTGDVAPVPLRENARLLLEAGLDGIIAAGSTGEASLLTDQEFRQLVEWLRDVVPPDRWLIAGTGKESTRATIKACQVAADEGADAVLVRAPSYYGSSLSPAALITHFRRIADESSLPVLVYNIPKYTHVAISDQVLASLLDHPNILGAKDSSGDLKNFASYRAAAPNWDLFMGNGALLYAALEMGAVGGILAAANYAAPLALKIRDRFDRKDKAAAGATQEVLAPLHKEIVAAMGPPGIKVAMEAVGLHGGPPRAPLAEISAKDRGRIAELLREAGLLSEGVAARAGSR